jgi:hypothetical protein
MASAIVYILHQSDALSQGCCDHEVSAEVEFEVAAPPKDSDRLRAIDLTARYGLDQKVDKSLVDEVWAAIQLDVPNELQPRLKRELNLIVGRRLASGGDVRLVRAVGRRWAAAPGRGRLNAADRKKILDHIRRESSDSRYVEMLSAV